jgi:hypothetical protein
MVEQIDEIIAEMEIEYNEPCKKCDYIIKTNDDKVGVSVTRIWRNKDEITNEYVYNLIQSKLLGLCGAREYVKKNKYKRMILHIWCRNRKDAKKVRRMYKKIIKEDEKKMYNNVHTICTICEYEPIYTNVK